MFGQAQIPSARSIRSNRRLVDRNEGVHISPGEHLSPSRIVVASKKHGSFTMIVGEAPLGPCCAGCQFFVAFYPHSLMSKWAGFS